jgi:solute carrier family 6 GABA transporter-like protein 1
VNNVALIFVVWSEVSSATTVYRWRDIVDQTGLPAFVVYNVGFFGGQIFGISLAHGIANPGAGAGAGIGFYVILAIVAVILARTPSAPAPKFWNQNVFVRKFWFLAFYSVSVILMNALEMANPTTRVTSCAAT